ncbi:hypothetical protein GCM10027404_17900 [Arthrobacter tumbae]|uniref:fumarylacetoacetate hydrolase family protein n=1 Tax=Arthrobacter tumbae TaxID=163874 RepID=UPI001EF8F4AF|nr:fumarylacetoacetate hydrolase family protein [Arthrobacter tumbae]MBM7780836.1 2-keto-4-pentenoate hydratase/2-oxohepta-3-ene-1,7-dioic acid hydratase in catechol pathway [Arthrobacter tumbae]
MMNHTLHLCSVREGDAEVAAVVHPQRGLALVRDLIPGFHGDVREILSEELLDKLEDLVRTVDDGEYDHIFKDPSTVTYGAPYRHPRMLWGIGLNYMEHASDLSEGVPEEPASFIKGDHTIIGPGEDIPIPSQSERTTAEGEVAVVIGRYCRNVEVEDALDYVAGVVPVLDQTAEDILQRNPRFLTRSKNFPGFFSFGPRIVPLAEAVGDGILADMEVSTVVNGEVLRTNTVAHMRYSPEYLISFHSKVMPLYPGDIISTGTPGAIHIKPGDVAEARVARVGTLTNPVTAGT